MSRPSYPFTRTVPVADVYHGVRVPDPYRWLEADDNPDVTAWIEAQNALTRAYLDGPARQALRARLAARHDFPRTSAPTRRGARYFFLRNTGLQDQDVLHVQDGPAAVPRVLLDPNLLSPDGTVSVTGWELSPDGRRLAYALSRDGSDRQEILVRDVDTTEDHPDRLQWAKFATVAWLEDGSGFYYTRFPQPGTVAPGDENYFNRVCFHRLGDPQDADALVHDRPDEREVVFAVDLTARDRYLVITAFRGASDKAEILIVDRQAPAAAPLVLFPGFDHGWTFIESLEGRLLFLTDLDAPLGRILGVTLPADHLRPAAATTRLPTTGSPGIVGARVEQIVAPCEDRLEAAIACHGQIVVRYLRRASSTVRRFASNGACLGDLDLPAIGTVTQWSGFPGDDELFFSFESFAWPPAPNRFDFTTGAVTPFAAGGSHVDSSRFRVDQVWYPSRDGTSISMFIVHRDDLALDGARPTLLSGYGGFNISLTPTFDASLFDWLEAGGVYAVANLRGGGEYGETWHEAGMLDRKQRVFEDFLAAAEWLHAHGYASPATLAIEGASNGGLLVAAALTQRPDLFGAVICRVPVADMLRYDLFTVGRFWVPEYGSSADPAQFAFLHAYSPYHHVVDGEAYPATLIMTADTDDRVAPGMARKLAARLQAATAGPAPILIRVEQKAGHGAGKPLSKVLDEDADIYSFLHRYVGAARGMPR